MVVPTDVKLCIDKQVNEGKGFVPFTALLANTTSAELACDKGPVLWAVAKDEPPQRSIFLLTPWASHLCPRHRRAAHDAFWNIFAVL